MPARRSSGPSRSLSSCVARGPALAQTLPWRRLLVVTALGSALWAIAVALVDGAPALTDPLTSGRNDYLQTAVTIDSLPRFLAGFVDNIAAYNQHTMGHPPGMVVIEWLMLRLHVASPGWHAALALGGGVAAGVAALVALRDVAGEGTARAASPFIVLVPAVIGWQTHDAFFAGVSAWAVTLVVCSTGRADRRGDRFAIAGGLLFGVTAFLSYGLVLMAVIPAVVASHARTSASAGRWRLRARRRLFAAFAAVGFFVVERFRRDPPSVLAGVASRRPYSYFVVADLALFAIAVGPAVAIGLAQLRDRKTRGCSSAASSRSSCWQTSAACRRRKSNGSGCRSFPGPCSPSVRSPRVHASHRCRSCWRCRRRARSSSQ